MSTYAIGDVQGCWDSLEALLARLEFNPNRDRLWLVGDLVNRGPKSLEVLRGLMVLGDAVQCVLGNHDLHLLAVAAGARKVGSGDTLQPILEAPDAAELLDWLRTRPLAVAEGSTLMVHAGVLPSWTMSDTLRHASEVENVLRGKGWKDFLRDLYGDSPSQWKDNLEGTDRLRVIVNVLTRLRYLGPKGQLEMKIKSSPAQAPAKLTPWFAAEERQTHGDRLVVGHWSTLGLLVRPNLLTLDTGCVWRGYLTAVRLEDHQVTQQLAVD